MSLESGVRFLGALYLKPYDTHQPNLSVAMVDFNVIFTSD